MNKYFYYFQKVRDLTHAFILTQTILNPRISKSNGWLENHQQRRLKTLLKHAKKNSIFYAEHLKTINPEKTPLEEIPILTKNQMMENYDELVVDPRLKLESLKNHLSHLKHDQYYENQYKIFQSGGSSKNPAIMAYNWMEFSYILSQILRATKKEVRMPFLRRLKGANVYARTPTHDSIRISQSFQVGLNVVKDYPVDMPIEHLIQELNYFQPDVLSGYPSKINELGHAKVNGSLKINPQAIFLGSEPLTPPMRKNISEAFGTEPNDHYGTTEAIVMACECPKHLGMHLNEDMHIIEIVDQNNRPVNPGEKGHKVLVTNLYAFTQPIIRYEVSDMMLLDENQDPCPCGNRMRRIKRIIGRNEDVFHFSNTLGKEVELSHEEICLAMEDIDNIRQFQAILKQDEILIKAILFEKQNENRTRDLILAKLLKLLQRIDVKIKQIRCLFVEELDRNPEACQKFRQIYVESP